MKLSEQIKSKIEKQKAVGHDSAAIVSYEMLNRWLDEAHELEQKLNIHGVMQAEASGGAEGAAVASEGQGEANTCADFCKCVSPNDCRKLDNCLLKFKYHRA